MPRRIVFRAAAIAISVIVAVSLACTPTALATTGVTSNVDADMVYYYGDGSSTHYVHRLGSEWVYCVDPYHTFKTGQTLTGVDAVKGKKLSQDCVTELALAYKYVWDEDLYTTPKGAKLKNNYERYAAAQVLMWAILVKYDPDIGPTHNRITVKGADITGDTAESENNKKALKWIAAHKDDYIGHCEYFEVESGQSFAMSFTATPLAGTIELVKSSGNTGITAGNASYSLAGANYGVFTDKDCKKSAGTLVTGKDGKATLEVVNGTYYVKETKAPAGYALNSTVYTVEVSTGKTVSVGGNKGVVDEPLLGSVGIRKVSANAAMTDGNDRYSLQDATYGLFDDAGCTAQRATLKTDANGMAQVDNIPLGTRYVKELAAPRGYALDSTVYTVVVEGDKVAYAGAGGTVADVPKTGNIQVKKVSANPSITDGNACYALAGATYGVFDDGACTTRTATLKVGADGTARAEGLPLGPHYVKELEAPKGYALDATVYTVEVEADQTVNVGASGTVADAPQAGMFELVALKRDAELADGSAQGGATLEGAQFTVCYYDGYYEEGELPSAPKRTWVVKTDAQGKARAADETRVEGDEFYRNAKGNIVIPLGTVTVRETAAPQGYRLGTGQDEAPSTICLIEPNGLTQTSVTAFEPLTASDAVMRGGVAVGKVDRQNGQYLPQGAATLEGATFEIVSDNDQRVVVDGTTYSKGSVVKTIQTQDEDGRFVARTDDACLPVGTYTVRESETSEGYLLDEASRDWSRQFSITSDGEVADLTDPDNAVPNQVIRGDFEFSKADGATSERLARVPFLIKSDTTGEAHVIVTDENGMASTAADWNPHSSNTNASDAAVKGGEDGPAVDEDALNPSSGIWFSGRADQACEADDELGALPFDTYTISELRCSANEGRDLVTFTTVISRDSRELDLGTIDDNPGPQIGTSLADGNGAKLVAASGKATLVDTVNYANVRQGQTYKLVGALHAVGEGGEDEGVIAEASCDFEPSAAAGSAEVLFTFDAGEVSQRKLVATEKLLDADGNELCSHEDLEDAAQSVYVPAIATHLRFGSEEGQPVSSVGAIELTDVVSYTGLTPGRTYTMDAALHVRADDGSDAGETKDSDGKPIVARQSFTPASSEGEVEVTFLFEAPAIAGKTVVAFEQLEFRDAVYATHADISDDAQSITFPAIATTLADSKGEKALTAGKEANLVDTVSYRNLVPNTAYALTGTLHVVDEDGNDHGSLRDESGTPVMAKTLFTPGSAQGTATVVFKFDATGLGGRKLVAFEVLADDAGRVVASHEDAGDEAQSVFVSKPKEPDAPKVEKEVPEKKGENPKSPTPVIEKKTVKSEKTTPASGTIAKTGDSLPPVVALLAPAAALGLAATALAVRQMRKREPLHVQRGPRRKG